MTGGSRTSAQARPPAPSRGRCARPFRADPVETTLVGWTPARSLRAPAPARARALGRGARGAPPALWRPHHELSHLRPRDRRALPPVLLAPLRRRGPRPVDDRCLRRALRGPRGERGGPSASRARSARRGTEPRGSWTGRGRGPITPAPGGLGRRPCPGSSGVEQRIENPRCRWFKSAPGHHPHPRTGASPAANGPIRSRAGPPRPVAPAAPRRQAPTVPASRALPPAGDLAHGFRLARRRVARRGPASAGEPVAPSASIPSSARSTRTPASISATSSESPRAEPRRRS